MEKIDFTITTLGARTITSPVKLSTRSDDFIANYTDDSDRIIGLGLDTVGPGGQRGEMEEVGGLDCCRASLVDALGAGCRAAQ